MSRDNAKTFCQILYLTARRTLLFSTLDELVDVFLSKRLIRKKGNMDLGYFSKI